jgi:hypothetical protein
MPGLARDVERGEEARLDEEADADVVFGFMDMATTSGSFFGLPRDWRSATMKTGIQQFDWKDLA